MNMSRKYYVINIPPTSVQSVALTAADQEGGKSLSDIHADIIRTQIFTRLDGPSLASAASVSSELHGISAEENLWREISAATWPSVNHPRVRKMISAFPSGHRTLFSDAFPVLDVDSVKSGSNSQNPAALISAVDIYYKNGAVLSKVQEMDTTTGWFLCSPFRVDILDPKESVQTRIQCPGNDDPAWLKDLEENLSLSWILIDPTRGRSGNFSTRKPVSVERHWLTREIEAKFSVILGAVECGVVVTCGGEEGKGMHVREVSMQMVDMEGKGMNGAESLGILAAAMEGGRRRRMKGNEGKEKYAEFVEKKRERKEKKQRAERALDLGCMVVGAVGLLAFWWAILLRR